jgi:RNA polymerase sigma-70 factor (ECF subfamily)
MAVIPGILTMANGPMANSYSSALTSAKAPLSTRRESAAGAVEGSMVEAVTELSLPESNSVDGLARLIHEMQRGNERALEELYDTTVGKVFALASAILRSVEDAEEVVCATYAYAWANANRFNAARSNALGWLLMLCRSRALDRLRQRRADPVTVDISEIEDCEAEDAGRPDQLLTLMQQRSHMQSALEKLTPQRRHLICLAFLQGLSHQEIAAATGMPLGTVKSHVRRALAQLREELEIR